ncbi:hypothetical protein [Microbacterium sp. HJ5]
MPIALSRMRIETGDLVIADDGGVVVVPRRQEDEVLALAREGASLRTVWDRLRML